MNFAAQPSGGRATSSSAAANLPPRPNGGVLSESIPLFFIGRNALGFWVVREATGRTGGVFLFRQSALRFANRSSAPAGCATMCLNGGLELDGRNQGNPIAAWVAEIASLVRSRHPAFDRYNAHKHFARIARRRISLRFILLMAPTIGACLLGAIESPALADAVEKPSRTDKPTLAKAPKRNAQAKPDKNQYWLLNPVPANQMRTFSTDRPTKSNVPYTVDAGHFQYETDLVNFTHQTIGAARTDTLLVPNPTFKLGVTNNADVEVNVPFAGVHTYGTAAPPNTLWGIGDTFVRSKINLWGNDGGDTAAAIIPYIKAPSAPIGIGNGAVEGGLIGPVAFNLPNSFVLLLVPETDVLKDNLDGGYHGNYVFDVNLSREMIKNVTAYVELWSDYNADPTARTTLMSFDTALAWTFLPNVQVDVGANFGLTSATPTVQVYAGLSQRF